MEHVPGSDLEEVMRELTPLADKPAASLSSRVLMEAAASAAQRRWQRMAARYQNSHAGADMPLAAPGDIPAGMGDDRDGYVRSVVTLARDLALALEEVHQAGMVHRDISPGNVMLTPRASRVVLMDFGLDSA